MKKQSSVIVILEPEVTIDSLKGRNFEFPGYDLPKPNPFDNIDQLKKIFRFFQRVSWSMKQSHDQKKNEHQQVKLLEID